MTIQELLKTFKSLEVITGTDVAKHLRKRSTEGSGGVVDSKYKELEDDRVQLYRSTPMGSVSKDVLSVDKKTAKLLAAKRGVQWRDGYADRVKLQWGSDQRVDRHGDIVLQDWDFKDFANNPAMPFNHNWDELPVGVHLDWTVMQRATSDYNGPALLLTSLYAMGDETDPRIGESLFRLVDAGMLRANSVGFVPGQIIQVNDQAEREKLGMGPYGDILGENLLLENSPTLLGANQGAMTILNSYRATGQLKSSDLDLLRELSRRSFIDTPELCLVEDEKWRGMARMLFPSNEFQKATDAEAPIVDLEAKEEESNSFNVTDVEPEIETLEIAVPAEEKEADMTQLLLGKMTQLISLVEMGLLSMQSQLDTISDSLMDDVEVLDADTDEHEEAKQRAIALIRSIKAGELDMKEPLTLAAELAALVHSSN